MPRTACAAFFSDNPWRNEHKAIPANKNPADASKTRSVRNGVKERTKTYVTEHTRKRDTVLRSICGV